MRIPANKRIFPDPRWLVVAEGRKAGKTYEEISRELGITRERARQLFLEVVQYHAA